MQKGPLMEIRQIYYVLEIAKQRSFSKAAKALYVTQPAISHQINALEAELQTKLFHRDTHNVSLTEDGAKCCEYAQKIVSAIDDLYNAFDLQNSDEKPVLRIGVYPFYGKSPLKQTLASFFAATNNVMGNIKVTDNYQAAGMIERGELDFAIVKARRENIPDIGHTILNEERLYAVVSRHLDDLPGTVMPIRMLGSYPLLTGEKGSHFYNEMRALYQKHQLDFNIAFMNTNETSMMQDMLRDGVGILLATEGTAMSLEDEVIVALPIEPREEFVTVLFYPKKPQRGIYLTFRNYIIDAFRHEELF